MNANKVTTKNWKSEKNIRWALIYYGNGQGEGMFDYASSFGNLHIMKNNEDHKLSLTLVVYFIVVRHILVIFFFAVIMKFFVEVVYEVITRQRKVEPPSTVEAGECKSMV
ncbi:unnamed protein product [Prunus armeniaca]|uniref:Uncharacterized protein n=1 Tax=Prunus armeniaca TaxID=36596 RepID=A0A6J5VXI8_PRUAR|nr:unnamed protein product [Prunus armeniaca]CAB4292397.1 unnamed protein product [Prunus armeniaca]